MTLILCGIQTAIEASNGGEMLEFTECACFAEGLCAGSVKWPAHDKAAVSMDGRRGLQPAVTQDHRSRSAHVPPGVDA